MVGIDDDKYRGETNYFSKKYHESKKMPGKLRVIGVGQEAVQKGLKAMHVLITLGSETICLHGR